MKRIFFTLMGILAFTPVGFAQQQVTAPQTASQTPVVTANPPAVMAMPTDLDPWQVSVEGGGLWSERDTGRLHRGEEITGRLTYDVTPNVAVGAESGGLRFEDEVNGVKYGHLEGVPALADLVLKMPIAATGNRLVPYIYGAAGVIFWSYSKNGYADTTGVDARSRTHFAAKPGGGLEYYLNPHVALFVEGSYLYSQKFTLKNASTTPPNGRIDVDSIYGGGGIKLAF